MEHLPPLNQNTIWRILQDDIPDQTVNELVWYYLGYHYDSQRKVWDNQSVAASWRETYPQPPDFILTCEKTPVIPLG